LRIIGILQRDKRFRRVRQPFARYTDGSRRRFTPAARWCPFDQMAYFQPVSA
jgi:hypothetical protein